MEEEVDFYFKTPLQWRFRATFLLPEEKRGKEKNIFQKQERASFFLSSALKKRRIWLDWPNAW